LVIPPTDDLDKRNLQQVELLGFPYQIYQFKSGQTVTQDTQFLFNTIMDKCQENELRVLELGSGTGVLSILLKLHHPGWDITGMEIQEQLYNLSQINASTCNLGLHFIHGDLKELVNDVKLAKFDLIMSNPPYFKIGEHRLSPNREKAISRHEVLCTMDDILQAVHAKLIKNGKAFIAYPTSRINELKSKIKYIDLQVIAEFSLSDDSHDTTDKTVIVELTNAHH